MSAKGKAGQESLRQNAEQSGLNGRERTSDSPEENEEQRASGSVPSKPASPTEPVVRAEQLKEEGNVAFRDKKYDTAVGFYSQAIDLQPNEPTYLTNRAAANMALKRFKSALADCQQAAALQSDSPSAKMLIRLARCQLATGASGPALSTLREVLELEPDNATAKQLQAKVLELEAHLRNFERARSNKEWGMARIALDKCQRVIEGEGGDIPSEWRVRRIELELARRNWDGATTEANEALRLDPNSADIQALRGLVLFLTAKLPAALQHAMSALRLDPDNALAKKLRQRVKAVVRLKDEGNASFKVNKWQEAIDRYTEALDCIGENVEEGMGGQMRATLLSNRATSLLKLDRHDDAFADINTSLELHPTSFKALRTRGRINVHLEQYEAAIRDFKTALENAASEGTAADVRTLRTELHAAEVDLKRSKTKDYYKILGVSRECTDTDLKKAYRRESLKHHPDKGGDEENFKLVSEAYSILSDPMKRSRYDAGEDIDGSMNSGPPGFGGMDPNDLANIFMQSHGAGFGSTNGNGFQFRSGGPSHTSFHF